MWKSFWKVNGDGSLVTEDQIREYEEGDWEEVEKATKYWKEEYIEGRAELSGDTFVVQEEEEVEDETIKEVNNVRLFKNENNFKMRRKAVGSTSEISEYTKSKVLKIIVCDILGIKKGSLDKKLRRGGVDVKRYDDVLGWFSKEYLIK